MDSHVIDMIEDRADGHRAGDESFDHAWRSGIQERFRTILADLRKKTDLLAELTEQARCSQRPTRRCWTRYPSRPPPTADDLRADVQGARGGSRTRTPR